MPKEEVEEFARQLLAHVRDKAISSCDIRLSPAARSAMALRWHKATGDPKCHDFAREIIPDCVDDAIFYLLYAIDEGLLQISFTAGNGKTVNLVSDGEAEMAGWFAGGVWKKAYSKERFNDDLADLDRYTGPDAP